MSCKWPISLARRSVRSSSAGTTIAHPTRNFDAMLSYSRSPTNAVQFAGDYSAELGGTIEDATRSGLETAHVVATALDPD